MQPERTRSYNPSAAGSLAARERLHHIGVSLAMLGIVIVFFGFLLGAERRAMQTHFDSHAARTVATYSVTKAHDLTIATLEAERAASAGFGRALLIAELGILFSAITVLLKRRTLWLGAVALVLTCLGTSTHAFSATQAELRAFDAGACHDRCE